jgi:hypothetical protein
LPPFLVKTQAAPLPLGKEILAPHPDHRAHPGEAIDHHADQGAIPEADDRANVDAIQERPRLPRRQYRRGAGRDHVVGVHELSGMVSARKCLILLRHCHATMADRHDELGGTEFELRERAARLCDALVRNLSI